MKNKKSVLIISALDYWSMGKGSGGPALYKTITGYAKHGWHVYFFTGNIRQDLDDDLGENIKVIRFDLPFLKRLLQIKKVGFIAKIFWWLLFQIKAFFQVINNCSKNDVDIIYGYEVDAMPVAKVISMVWRIPLVARFQGSSFLVGWEGKKCKYLRAWEHFVGLKIPADLIIMTNDGTKGDKVLEQLGVDMRRVLFWMNGVDKCLFQITENPNDAKVKIGVDGKHVLLCVSRLVRWKRVERAIYCLPSIIKRFPNTILIIVGDGPEKENLKKLVNEMKLTDVVRFEGAIPHERVPIYYAAADLFLSLYDWSNLCNPLIEAMTAGKCVVTINNGDTWKIIKNYENGVLLEYSDIHKLSEIIIELIKNDFLRKYLGQNAFKFANENFWDWEKRIEEEINIVNRMLD